MRFEFTDIESVEELNQCIDFLYKQDLSYPNYRGWVPKCKAELVDGYKKGIITFFERRIVGDVIYQPHKKNPGFLEVKNLRVHPQIRGRYCPTFMLKQVVVENPNYDAMIVDAPSEFPNVIAFFESCGFIPILSKPLYDDGAPDIVMIKPIKKSRGIIVPRALDLF